MKQTTDSIVFRLFAWALLAAGLVLLGCLSVRYPLWVWLPLLFTVPVVLLGYSFSFQMRGSVYVSYGMVICLQYALLFGPLMAAWMAAISAALNELLLLRRGPHMAARSAGMHILMWLAGGVAYQAVGGTFPLLQLEILQLLQVLMLFVVLTAVNRAIMVVDRWLRGASVHEYLIHTTPRTLLIEATFVPVGAVMAVIYTAVGPTAFVVMTGMLMLALAAARQLKRDSEVLEQQVVALRTLNRVGQLIGSSLEIGPLLETIYRGASDLIDTSTFWIVLYDRERQTLAYELFYDQGEPYPPVGDSYQPNVGLAGYLIEHRRPLLTHTLRELEQLPVQLTTIGMDQLPESVLGVPMMVEGRVLGAITAQSYQQRAFTEQDLQVLTTLANQAAVAVENAQLFRRAAQIQQDLRAVLDGVTHAMVVTDLQGRVRLANRATEELFGVSESAVIGLPLAEVISHQSLTSVAARIASGEILDLEALQLELSDGRVLLAHLSPVISARGERSGYTVAMTDVTALQRLSQLKSLIIRLASHDLRNPLHLIGNFFEILVEEPAQFKAEQHRLIERVRHYLAEMKHLIDELLNLERIEESDNNQWESINTSALIQEVVADQRLHAEIKGQRLSSALDSALPTLRGDRTLLAQALTNLIDNAIKYTPEGGEIVVRAWTETGNLEITVEDNGIGIPVENQCSIFDQFYRARQPGTEHIPGSGLGLNLVRGIVQRHKGRVWVKSEGIPGRGSTLGISLPLD